MAIEVLRKSSCEGGTFSQIYLCMECGESIRAIWVGQIRRQFPLKIAFIKQCKLMLLK